MMKEQVGGMVDKNQGGLVVWRWEGKGKKGGFGFGLTEVKMGVGSG